MKRNLFETGVFILAILFLSSFSLRENPQDPPRGKKKERHINFVKIDDDRNRMELDTIIKGDGVFVWNGDTIGGADEMKWFSKDGFKHDSLHKRFNMNFDYEISDDGHGNVFVIKSGKGSKHRIHEFKLDGDSAFALNMDENVIFGGGDDAMFWVEKGNHNMVFGAQRVAGIPHPPHVRDIRVFGKPDKANVIDLSDPGIISFKKKTNKDGTEKITIVRKPIDKDTENGKN
jgi:hypothetical protein